jgi:hypothetical protein
MELPIPSAILVRMQFYRLEDLGALVVLQCMGENYIRVYTHAELMEGGRSPQ